MDGHDRRLAVFLAGDLDDATAAGFDEHLISCERCWQAVREDRAGRAAAARLRQPAPTELASRVRLAVEQANGRRRRQPARLVLAACVLLLATAVAAVLALARPDWPVDSPAIAAVVTAAHRMPAPSAASAPGPAASGQPWTVLAGGSHLRLQYYLLDGVELLVVHADRPFAMPEDARPVAAGAMPWALTRDGVTLYCPHDTMLVAAAIPAERLAALARQLPEG